MKFGKFIGFAYSGEEELAEAFASVGLKHMVEPEIKAGCKKLALWSAQHAEALLPFMERYKGTEQDEPEELRDTLFSMLRATSYGLLRDLQNLWLLVNEVKISCVALEQGAYTIQDKELVKEIKGCLETSERQLLWLETQIKHLSAQVLVVA